MGCRGVRWHWGWQGCRGVRGNQGAGMGVGCQGACRGCRGSEVSWGVGVSGGIGVAVV